MMSTCPNCLSQVRHEDHLLQVACECGTTFQPFVTGGDPLEMEPTPGLDHHMINKVAMTGGNDFEESDALFKELRDFGEGLSSEIVVPPQPKQETAVAEMPSAIPDIPEMPMADAAPQMPTEWLITTGDNLQGYQISSYFPPISMIFDLDSSQADPLSVCYEPLWNRASTLGANAIISLRWSLSADGQKILVSATPIQCAKAQ